MANAPTPADRTVTGMDTVADLDRLLDQIETIRAEAANNPDFGFGDDWEIFIRKMRCLPPQSYGRRLERWLTRRWGWTSVPAAHNRGDVVGAEGKHWEVKISLLGRASRRANFVQIRPYQRLDGGYQLFVVDADNRLHRFVFTSQQMAKELEKLGTPAHGVASDVNDQTEWAIRLTWREDDPHYRRWQRLYSRPGLPNGHTVEDIGGLT